MASVFASRVVRAASASAWLAAGAAVSAWHMAPVASAEQASPVPLAPDAKRVAVFCGSSLPTGPHGQEVVDATARLAKALVQEGAELVYGGGNVGLMGVVSSGVDEAGGVVRGVIPKALHNFELVTLGAQPQHLTVTDTMHERKALMAKLSSAFIALPGGFGTFEELLEAITWTQLAVHNKPVGVLNVAGYYDPLLAQVDRAVEFGFIAPTFKDILVVEADPEKLVQRLMTYKPPKGYELTWEGGEDEA
ncbi:LOGL2 [Symbiodinium sp. KB8]|nr:LOGL2 [Symbiodinium sp. KB8]